MYSRYLEAHPDTPKIAQKLLGDDSAQIDWQDIFVSAEHGIGEILSRVLENKQKKDNSKTRNIGKCFEKMIAFFKGLLQISKMVSEVSHLRFCSLTI